MIDSITCLAVRLDKNKVDQTDSVLEMSHENQRYLARVNQTVLNLAVLLMFLMSGPLLSKKELMTSRAISAIP